MKLRPYVSAITESHRYKIFVKGAEFGCNHSLLGRKVKIKFKTITKKAFRKPFDYVKLKVKMKNSFVLFFFNFDNFPYQTFSILPLLRHPPFLALLPHFIDFFVSLSMKPVFGKSYSTSEQMGMKQQSKRTS